MLQQRNASPNRPSDPKPADPKRGDDAPFLDQDDEELLDYINAHLDEPSSLDDDDDED